MFDETKLADENGTSAAVSVKNWLVLDCIQFLNIIPIIGTIAALVILLIIAFGGKSAVSVKNRIIADLIWLVIAIVAFFFFTMFGGMALLAAYAGR